MQWLEKLNLVNLIGINLMMILMNGRRFKPMTRTKKRKMNLVF